MANFSYNWYSGESRLNQYAKHLQNQNYVNQIENSIRETGAINTAVVDIQTKEIENAIQVSSGKHREAIIHASDAICSTLESGFLDLKYGLKDIKNGIYELSNLVGHGFSLIVEGQKITHKYLGHIQNLLRVPDSQKQRVYHIDEGMKYLQNAFRQNSDSEFYTDALEEFQEALDKEKRDFFSLYHIGFIFLKSTKHLNPKNAEIYFRNAARYYLAEALISGTNVSNNLLQSHRGFLLEAAEAYLFAAEACYIQEKFSEAVELAEQAWKTFPDLTKAGLMQAKYLAANTQVSQAVMTLEKAIRINRYLTIEVIPDFDLNSKPEIIRLLDKLNDEALQEAKTKYEICSKVILPYSNAIDYLEKIDKLVDKNTFLTSKRAIDLLDKVKDWEYCCPNKNEGNTKIINLFFEIHGLISTLSHLTCYKPHSDFIYEYGSDIEQKQWEFVMNKFIEEINASTQWVFPNLTYNFRRNTNIQNKYFEKIKGKIINCNISQFVESEKKMDSQLSDAIVKLNIYIQGYVDYDKSSIDKFELDKTNAEKERKHANRKNLELSVFNGFIWGITVGVIVGSIVGAVIGGILYLIIEAFSHKSPEALENIYNNSILVTQIICGLLVFAIGFSSKRVEL